MRETTLRAFVTNHLTSFENDLAALDLGSSETDGEAFRAFSLNSGLYGFPPNGRAVGNFYFANWHGLFEQVSVGPSVRLFNDAWGRAFLRHCCRALRPGGSLRLSGNLARGRGAGGWQQDDLRAFLNPKSLRTSGKTVVLDAPSPASGLESVLDWFLRDSAGHLLSEILLSNNSRAASFDQSDPLVSRMRYEGDGHAATASAEPISRSDEAPWLQPDSTIAFETTLQKLLKTQSYYIGGIAYKGPILKHILREHGLAEQSLSAIDFGGGYGLLMGELLLDPALTVERAIVRDILPSNGLLAGIMFRELFPHLDSRFQFSLGAAEDFDFRGRFDLVTFVGSLLYVPFDKRLPTLQKCWDALKPGGLLVVHENIKAPSYVRDHDIMFTVDEIDDLLGRFGDIRRFASAELRSLSRNEAAAKSVFRAVQKQR